jgi:hypothetical protein
VNDLLAKHGINVHDITYVKDEKGDFSTMISILTFVVSYEVLGLSTPFCRDLLGPCDVQALPMCHK